MLSKFIKDMNIFESIIFLSFVARDINLLILDLIGNDHL